MANTCTYGEVLAGNGVFKRDSTRSVSVKRMQMKLYKLQYSIGTPDGIFGENTKEVLEAFQTVHGLPVTGEARDRDLKELDRVMPDTEEEILGRELTHNEIINGFTSSKMSQVESLARCIYGEDTINSSGQCAVAKEIYNRKNSTRTFLQRDNTWKGYVYGTMIQYEVMTGDASGTKNSRAPDVYTDSWSYCVGLAKLLCEGRKPSSRLGGQCFHVGKSSSYPSNAVESTKIQIPSGTGNKFYDTISNP